MNLKPFQKLVDVIKQSRARAILLRNFEKENV
jgi:hypothetical protein